MAITVAVMFSFRLTRRCSLQYKEYVFETHKLLHKHEGVVQLEDIAYRLSEPHCA